MKQSAFAALPPSPCELALWLQLWRLGLVMGDVVLGMELVRGGLPFARARLCISVLEIGLGNIWAGLNQRHRERGADPDAGTW